MMVDVSAERGTFQPGIGKGEQLAADQPNEIRSAPTPTGVSLRSSLLGR